MRIISLIDDAEITRKILKRLDLWDVKRRPPPRAKSPPTEAFIIYDGFSVPSADDYIIDADYFVYPLSFRLDRRLPASLFELEASTSGLQPHNRQDKTAREVAFSFRPRSSTYDRTR